MPAPIAQIAQIARIAPIARTARIAPSAPIARTAQYSVKRLHALRVWREIYLPTHIDPAIESEAGTWTVEH